MSKKLPCISGKKVIKILAKVGFRTSNIKGSHCILIRDVNPPVIVVVPLHNKLKKGTLRNIIKDAGLTREEFFELLEEK
nr:type II toxin-antitoxin system HicA family toxin [Candidatus Freyarchaeota archaeon]